MEEALSINNEFKKELKSQVIKTIVGSIVGSLLMALALEFSFYYKTNASLDRLNEIQATTTAIVDKHTELINQTINGQGMSGVQQQNFEKRLNQIEEGQKEILRVLLEVNSGQKTIIKNQ
jgi:membrane peptidoglycan carboxypeptidase